MFNILLLFNIYTHLPSTLNSDFTQALTDNVLSLLQESNEKSDNESQKKKRMLEIIEEREEKERKRLARAATRAANKAKKEAEPLVVSRRSSRKRTPKKLD